MNKAIVKYDNIADHPEITSLQKLREVNRYRKKHLLQRPLMFDLNTLFELGFGLNNKNQIGETSNED